MYMYMYVNILFRLQDEREKQAELRGQPKMDRHVAATHIQKVYIHVHVHVHTCTGTYILYYMYMYNNFMNH